MDDDDDGWMDGWCWVMMEDEWMRTDGGLTDDESMIDDDDGLVIDDEWLMMDGRCWKIKG